MLLFDKDGVTSSLDASYGGAMDLTADQARSALETGSNTVSVDGPEESQINIKGDRADIERFRHVARRDGLRLIGLLRRALDAYEQRALQKQSQ
jgi:hypothetical protein